MSLPGQVPLPSHSSSPSKSSLRRSGDSNQAAPKRSLLPSPQFKEPPLFEGITAQYDDECNYEEIAAELSSGQPNDGPPPQPTNFQPFFALVEDAVTHEHFHPTVHYIFADDDTDIIIEAACRSLEQEGASESQAVVSGGESRYLPRPADGVREHYLVLDVHTASPFSVPVRSGEVGEMGGTLFEVTNAQSMSSEWQVLKTSITNAPTIGDGADGDGQVEGLMLRIEGRGNTPPDTEREGKGRENEKESVEELIERFQKRLDDVRMVMLASHVRTGTEDED